MTRTQAKRPSHHHLTDDAYQDQAAAHTNAVWEARLAALPEGQAAKARAEMTRGVRTWAAEIRAGHIMRPASRPRAVSRIPRGIPAARRRPSPPADDDTPGEPGGAHVHEALAARFAVLAGTRRLPCPHRVLVAGKLDHITFAENTVRCVACERDGVRLADIPPVPWTDGDGHRWTDGRATARAMRLAA